MTLRWRYETWRKLYVREEGTFAGLPLFARALAGELLKFADVNGRIPLGGKEPWLVVAQVGRAEMGERRLLRRLVPLLIADNYLVVTGDWLWIRNMVPAQEGRDRVVNSAAIDREIDAIVTRPELESSANGDSVVHEPSTSGARVVHDSGSKNAEASEFPCGTEVALKILPSLPSLPAIPERPSCVRAWEIHNELLTGLGLDAIPVTPANATRPQVAFDGGLGMADVERGLRALAGNPDQREWLDGKRCWSPGVLERAIRESNSRKSTGGGYREITHEEVLAQRAEREKNKPTREDWARIADEFEAIR